MLISKSNVYKTEWLDLVFNHRNQSYGAYELRQTHSKIMGRALLITFSIVSIVAFAFTVFNKPVVVPEKFKITEVPLMPIVVPPKTETPKPAVLSHPHTHAPVTPKTVSAPTIRFLPPVVTPNATTEIPKVSEIGTKAIGPDNTHGDPNAHVDIPDDGPGTTTGTPGGDNSIHLATGLERMPEPYGGAAAWGKFLQKHLRYPQDAIEQHMQGRVFLSFVVEKDGSLSNFVVTRGIGFGLDEEALRVLKIAPAWKPGLQNGQPVRVQYNIPINFQLNDDDR